MEEERKFDKMNSPIIQQIDDYVFSVSVCKGIILTKALMNVRTNVQKRLQSIDH